MSGVRKNPKLTLNFCINCGKSLALELLLLQYVLAFMNFQL